MLESLYLIMLIVSLLSLVAFGFVLVPAFKKSVLWGLAVLLIPLFGFLVFAIKFWAEVKKPVLAYLATIVLQLGVVGVMFTELGGMEAITVAQGIQDGTLTEQEAAQFMVASMAGMEKMGGPGKEQMLAEMRQDPNVTPEQMAQAEQLFSQMEKLAAGEIQSMEEGWVNSEDQPKVESSSKIHLKPEGVVEAHSEEVSVDAMVEVVAPEETEVEVATAAAEVAPAPEVASPMPVNAKPAEVHIGFNQARDHIGKDVLLTTVEGIQREGIIVAVSSEVIEIERREFSGAMSYKINVAKIKDMQLK